MTPMLAQYMDVKKKNPDCLLFFRLGDFYELFYEDAKTASRILNITLTKRSREKDQDVPMCGVPFHAAENYIAKLIKANEKVAICEQMETPEEAKKRGYKAIVRRDVVRVITPGTLTEEGLLEEKSFNFLACAVPDKKSWGLAFIDISTGDFFTTVRADSGVLAAVLPLAPKELLVPEAFAEHDTVQKIISETGAALSLLPASRFSAGSAETKLLNTFQVKTLEGFGQFEPPAIRAAGALLEYVSLTQCGVMPKIKPVRVSRQDNRLLMDYATLRNLEIFQTLKGERSGTLLSAIDHTQTSMGARFLVHQMMTPLMDKDALEKRYQHVEKIQSVGGADVQRHLAPFPDVERILGRLSLGRGGPRDLIQIRGALQAYERLKTFCAERSLDVSFYGQCPDLSGLRELLESAVDDEAPLLARDGGFVRPGYHEALDEYRALRDESSVHVAMLQKKYCEETGIPTLKIKHNNVLGYFIELTNLHKDKVPGSFIHRQTLVNASRYATDDLLALQEKIVEASDKALALELEIFDHLLQALAEHEKELGALCELVACLDVAASHAVLAGTWNYVKPTLHEDTRLMIEEGRHPVVEQLLARSSGESFAPNACGFSESVKLWLMTGPNMAGKSTFLRQNALIVFLAHIGCYVPAKKADIGLVDRIFSRVGASDDLSRGQSTFMVEMVETAAILNQSTEKSFVILDEIGRGTATHDGLAIAWAIAEYIHDKLRCRGLFATHYHELTRLRNGLKRLACYTMAVKEWQDEVVFLHKVVEGVADQSYGIYVAQLAGLPKKVIERAQTLLREFQEKQRQAELSAAAPLFQQEKHGTMGSSFSDLADEIEALDLDCLSPRDALDTLYALKKEIKIKKG